MSCGKRATTAGVRFDAADHTRAPAGRRRRHARRRDRLLAADSADQWRRDRGRSGRDQLHAADDRRSTSRLRTQTR